ncbi:DUF424 family protein [Candidatus Woesearchaeota archaeon]|nr:DUF424 family protein [Candidatus Woesearchaeota archaeon]
MRLVVKIHHKDGRTVVAVCDSDLIDSVFEEGNTQLDLTKDFYKGDVYEDAQAIGDIIRNADCVNIVGEKAVKLALNEGVLEEGHIKTIGGIPHAQVVIIHEA